MASVFERIEKKYLLTQAQYQGLRIALQGRMVEDEYGLHTICNLYMDTDDWALIRQSIEKPVYKEKMRLRTYGTPGADSAAFLELKKKLQGVVYKRRVTLPLQEAMQYIEHRILPREDTQILREIDWAMQRQPLSPKVCLCYDRQALAGRDDPSLRVTFDDNIRFRLTDLDLTRGSWGTQLLADPLILMEVKALGSMPVWFAHLMAELQIAPTSFSKYGVCYRDFIAAGAQILEGGLAHAS